jgi:hypothetical protein
MRSLVTSLLALVLFGASLPAQTPAGQPYTWNGVAVGGGGFVSGIVFHPTERGLVYARTDVSGAFRWDVPRQEWIPLNYDIGGLNNEFMRLGVLSLAVDRHDANRLYLAVGQYTWDYSWNPDCAILRSSDRGATWTRTIIPGVKAGGNEDGRNTGERLVVDPNDGQVLYLGTNNNGLWRSADRGVSWSKVSSFAPTSCTLVLIDPLSGTAGSASQTIFVGVNTTTGSSLYRSTDGGANWAPVPGQPAGLMPHHADIAALSGVRYLFLAYSNRLGPNGISAGAVWRVNLANDGWTNVTPVSGAWGYAGISVDASNNSTVITSTIDRWGPRDEIYRSTDGGANWTPVLQTGTLDHSQAPWAAASTPHWTTDVKIDPFDSSRAMFVTGYGLFETGNLGASPTVWRFSNRGLEETATLGIVSPPSGAPLVSTMGDIDGFRHDDLRTEPASRHTPLRGTNRGLDFAENLPSKMVRTFDGGTRGAYSLDGAATWTAFPTAVSTTANGGAIAISADGATIVWSQENTAARRSTNNGTSWTACTGAPSSTSATYAPVSDRVNAAKFYIYNQTTGILYVSTDAAATFAPAATLPTGAAALRAAPGLEGHLWIPCWSNGLRRSTNSGSSFATVASVQEAYSVGFGKAAPGRTHPAVFIWGKVGGVVGFFRSDDTGDTWVRINDDKHQFGYAGLIVGDPRVFGRVYVAGNLGIVYGEIPAVLPAYAWAPFTVGVSGSWTPPAHTSPYTPAFSASGLPAWATIDGATGVISGTPTDAAGTITQATITASAGGQVVGTMKVNVVAASAGSDLAPVNMSTRGRVGIGDQILIPGFVVGGSAPRTFLVRVVGPTLGGPRFNVPGTVADPTLSVVDRDGIELFSNDNWGDNANVAALRAAFTATGAFRLDEGSRDAALLVTLQPGLYTAKASGVGGTTGVALVEVYDATTASTGGTLENISTRAVVGAGDQVLIPGIVFRGGGTKRLLVRAVGPTLARFNVNGVLPDPQVTIMKDGVPLATNDDWCTGNDVDEIRAVGATVSAFNLPTGSRDAVLLTTLPEYPQGYTIVVSGRGDTTGIALVEVYVVD